MATEPSHEEIRHLRARAGSLRRLAGALERTPALALEPAAGDDTWSGPTPSRLVAELRRLQHAVHAEVDALRSAGWWLDRRADELETRRLLASIAG